MNRFHFKMCSDRNSIVVYSSLMDLQLSWKLKIVDQTTKKQKLIQLHKLQLIYSDLCQLRFLYLEIICFTTFITVMAQLIVNWC